MMKAIELAERVDRAIDELEAAVEALHAECSIHCREALTPKRGKPHPLYERSLDFLRGALHGRHLIGVALGDRCERFLVAEPFQQWANDHPLGD